MLRFISLFVLSEHCVQDGQQFTHTVNQRHFFGFSGCWQSKRKLTAVCSHQTRIGNLDAHLI